MIDEIYYKDILDDKYIKIIHNDYYENIIIVMMKWIYNVKFMTI